jgi:hypothetical protein
MMSHNIRSCWSHVFSEAVLLEERQRFADFPLILTAHVAERSPLRRLSRSPMLRM